MSKKILIGIDIGTSTVKAVFLNAESGSIVTTQTEEIFNVKAENPDWLEYNADEWWEYTKRILNRGLKEGNIDPKDVAGVCFGGWTVMAFMVDENGKPINNPTHYGDMRHMDEVEELNQRIGNICVDKNGNYIGMYSGTAKQLWWKNKRPDVYKKAKYFVTETSWINWKLTGVWGWNRPEAGFYSQYNTHTRQWDKEILDKVGFSESMFPKLYDAWEKVGEVTAKASEDTGLAVGTPVFAATDDATPVAITTGSIENGQCYLSIGSGGNICANSAGVVSHPTCIVYPHCVPNLNLVVTVISSMGVSYKWMRNTFAQAETAVAQMTGEDPYSFMNKEAELSRPGAGGIVFLPYLEGDYTPNNDANARGAFIGISSNNTKNDMLRAVLEGSSMAVWSNIQLIEKLGGVKFKEIIITGGPAKSKIWLQIISDVTGCAISLPEETEGAPFGNAIVAGVGTGVYKNYAEAVQKMVRIKRNVCIPDMKNHEIYSEIFPIYEGLYSKLADTYDALANIKKKNS
jgi:xylulokinase